MREAEEARRLQAEEQIIQKNMIRDQRIAEVKQEMEIKRLEREREIELLQVEQEAQIERDRIESQ